MPTSYYDAMLNLINRLNIQIRKLVTERINGWLSVHIFRLFNSYLGVLQGLASIMED